MGLMPLATEAVLFAARGALFLRAAVRAGHCCSLRSWCFGTVGFASVGTLFAAMLVRQRTRDVLLPILLYPITVPVIIAGVRGTSALVQAPPDEAIATLWIGSDGLRCGVRVPGVVDVRSRS